MTKSVHHKYGTMVTSTYYLGGVASRIKLLSIEGDNTSNDLIALKKFEKYVEHAGDDLYRYGNRQKKLTLEKTVSTEMVSIPLQKVERERKTYDIHGPNPDEMIRQVFYAIDSEMASDLITIAIEAASE